ncbi:YfbK domain-containing protein [Parahaliea mediterranea]|uniref:YfbK domain-containing protein n=1 Tax=Parahaliea mediterranea TaxID=651086 RepID=UPI001F496337|nr:YfbK domain-containing protein [Parahaliea mediterranea]
MHCNRISYNALDLKNLSISQGNYHDTLIQALSRNGTGVATALRETRFAAAVAGFAELLRGGKYSGDWDYDKALELAQENRGDDPYGYRSELVQLIRKAEIAAGM